jgi:hypothetical protein
VGANAEFLVRLLGGAALYVMLLSLHQPIIGVSPSPDLAAIVHARNAPPSSRDRVRHRATVDIARKSGAAGVD